MINRLEACSTEYFAITFEAPELNKREKLSQDVCELLEAWRDAPDSWGNA